MVLMNIGLAYRERGDAKEAIPVLEESRNIYKKLSPNEDTLYLPRLANVLSHLGVAYLMNKRFKVAEKSLEESLNIYERLDQQIIQFHLDGYSFALNHMGTLQFRIHKLDEALSYFEKSLDLFEELSISNQSGFTPYIGMTLVNISAVYIEKGDGKKAERIGLRALRIYASVMKNRPLIFLGNGVKLIGNLRTMYEKTMNLSHDDAEVRLRTQLEDIFGNEMARDLLKLLKESGI